MGWSEDAISQADLMRAIKRKKAFLKDPEKHTYEENISQRREMQPRFSTG